MSELMIFLSMIAGASTLVVIGFAVMANSISLLVLAIGLALLTWLFGWLVNELS